VIVLTDRRASQLLKGTQMGERTMRFATGYGNWQLRVRGLTLAFTAALAVFCLAAAAAQAGDVEIVKFAGPVLNRDQSESIEAGGRAFEQVNDFAFNIKKAPNFNGEFLPAENIKDVKFNLPPGIVGAVAGFPTCSPQGFDNSLIGCPTAAQIGVAVVKVYNFAPETLSQPVYNLERPEGMPAQFGFVASAARIRINFGIRSGSDYGVTASLHNLPTTLPVYSSRVAIWGVPADPRHDDERGECASPAFGPECETPYPLPEVKPFLANPTSCTGPIFSTMTATSWQNPGVDVDASPSEGAAMNGCGQLEFDPTINAAPSTSLADSPSGFDFHLHVPQHNEGSFIDEPVPGTDEVQSLSVLATEGQFRLSFGGESTSALASNASAATVQGALEGLSSIGADNVSVSGGPGDETGSTPYAITFVGALGGIDVEQLVAENGTAPLKITNGSGTTDGGANVSTTTPGVAPSSKHVGVDLAPATAHLRDTKVVLPAGLTVNPSSANGLGACTIGQIGFIGLGDEQQTISYIPRETASFTLTFGAQTSDPLAGTAPRNAVLAALENLPGLAGNVALAGSPGSWRVSFVGALAHSDAPALSGTATPNSVQTLEVTGTEGTYHLSFDGSDTSELAFDASAKAIEEALQQVPTIGSLNAFVEAVGTSGDTRSYEVHFNGAFAGTQPALLTSASSPEGPSVAIAQAPSAQHPLSIPTTTEAGPAAQFTPDPADCPDASKLGTVTIKSPAVIDHPLEGDVYLATPHQNPFNSLLAIYITVNDPKSGVVVKLPGLIEADPKTGQLTATVTEAPQLPFEDLELSFFKGAGAPLKTGIACGTSEVKTDMVPWSAPEGATMHPSDSFTIDHGAGGGPCVKDEASAPNAPKFEAGTVTPKAGAYTPFSLKLTRADGTQQLTGIDTILPKGLIARLAGTPYCSDAALAAAATKTGKAEQASPSCPAASKVGSVTVGAGAGPTPFYTSGNAYLSGPYKGAPLSLAVVTPAVAGPFDLGTVVVRNALHVDPASAVVHAVSDPFPSILEGIPLDLRSIALNLDKPEFTKNPTSCAPFAITGLAQALSGQSAPLNEHFQVGSCNKLAFKPKLHISLHGEAKRSGNPALTAVLKMGAGQANIAKTTVLLPASQFIDTNHINNPCTRVQFNADQCPASSILGAARAFTPLLDQPLEGPVYFRSNGGERELPDLVADLRGQIHVTLVGFIDTVPIKGTEKARIRTTFADIPDAPVSKFLLRLYGGKRGLIENSKNLCRGIGPAGVQMDGHNGKLFDFDVKLGTSCPAAKKKAHKHQRSRR
jgi:hypothetical protein